jgi:hypothetical protein
MNQTVMEPNQGDAIGNFQIPLLGERAPSPVIVSDNEDGPAEESGRMIGT